MSLKTEVFAYHYPSSQKSIPEIKRQGLLAPSQLAGTPAFKEVLLNYKSRIKEKYKGTIDDEVVLDYLDYLHADITNDFHCGRNFIFALLNPVIKGVSKQHDKMLKEDYVGIDLTRLLEDQPNTKVFIIELPFEDCYAAHISLEQIHTLQKYNMLNMYDKEKSDGLMFGGVPHLAILTKNGKIAKKYLKHISH